MTQKLLIIERDTKEELQKAIEKNVLNGNLRVITFSVLEQRRKEILQGNVKPEYFEAWIIIEID